MIHNMTPTTQIREYILEEKIGEGGMATVWRATHIHLEKSVAIKVMSQSLMADPSFGERFLREARAMAKLQHPNILSATDFFQEHGGFYLVMPYIDNGSLESRLTLAKGPLPVPEAIAIAQQILAALDYAHQKGVIHRDVKPSNILLDTEGRAYLADFGIALMLGESRKTRTGTSIGTPHYMSPEQIMRPKTMDHRADVYSFGCVLFEMLTGAAPFTAGDDEGDADLIIKNAHLQHAPPDPRNLNSKLPKPLEDILLKVLQKEPNARYQGCGEFARALETFAQPGQKKGPATAEKAPPLPAASPIQAPPGTKPRSQRSFLFVGLGAAALLVGTLLWAANRTTPAAPVTSAPITPSPAVPPPTPEVPRGIIQVVTASGKTPYATLDGALRAVPEGGTVEVGAGEWDAGIEIRRSVTIRGTEGSRPRLKASADMPVLRVSGGKILLLNLDLHQGAAEHALEVISGTTAATECRFYSAQIAGIGAYDSETRVQLMNCTIEDCGQAGLLVSRGASASLERCTVWHNGSNQGKAPCAGIEAANGGKVTIIAPCHFEANANGDIAQTARPGQPKGIVEQAPATANANIELKIGAQSRRS